MSSSAEASAASCISCKKPLISLDAPYCTACGSPQSPTKECVNVDCKVQLPLGADFCFKCGKPQPRPQKDPSMKWCMHCKEQVKHSDDGICLKCKKTSESLKSCCIFCERPLSLDGNGCCKFCTASQDTVELSKRSFKKCHRCDRRLLYENTVCVSKTCNALQTSPTSLPDEQSHAPGSTPRHSRNGQLNQDPPPLPFNPPPDLSLPTDPPSHTKEELIKLFAPQGSNSDDVHIEEKRVGTKPVVSGDTPDMSIEKASSSFFNDKEDNKSLDAISKKARAISEAAKVSGAVLNEKVDPTFGIKGETTTNDSIGSSMSMESHLTRKRKQLDQDQDTIEPPDPKKPGTVSEDNAALHKELDKITEKIEKAREELKKEPLRREMNMKIGPLQEHSRETENDDKATVLETKKECNENRSITYPQKNDVHVEASKGNIEVKNDNTTIAIPQKSGAEGTSYVAEASDSESEFSPPSSQPSTTTHATSSPGTSDSSAKIPSTNGKSIASSQNVSSSTPDHPLIINDDKHLVPPQPGSTTESSSIENDNSKCNSSGNGKKNEADAEKNKIKKGDKEEKSKGRDKQEKGEGADKSVEKGKSNQSPGSSKKTDKDKKANVVVPCTM